MFTENKIELLLIAVPAELGAGFIVRHECMQDATVANVAIPRRARLQPSVPRESSQPVQAAEWAKSWPMLKDPNQRLSSHAPN
jgi:hypothetical protein